MNNPRKPEESKEQYHARLKQEQKVLDAKLAGHYVWMTAEKGTFNKTKVISPPAALTPREHNFSSAA